MVIKLGFKGTGEQIQRKQRALVSLRIDAAHTSSMQFLLSLEQIDEVRAAIIGGNTSNSEINR